LTSHFFLSWAFKEIKVKLFFQMLILSIESAFLLAHKHVCSLERAEIGCEN